MSALPDYAAELESLRRSYVEANPSQRLKVARDRLRYPDHGPNVLVACVSAVEGFARCLVVDVDAKSKEERSATYPRYRFKGAEDLISEYLARSGLGEPESFFGADTWKLFQFAVEYRNLLAHECTYLGQDHSPALVTACHAVLSSLAATKGLVLEKA